MRTSSTIATIWSAHGSKFISHEMFASSSAMSTTAENLYLIYKV
jgi:hypothetical protein